jgi:hypothetical protein
MPIHRHPNQYTGVYAPRVNGLLDEYAHLDSMDAFKKQLQVQEDKRIASLHKQKLHYASHYNGFNNYMSADQRATLYNNYDLEDADEALASYPSNAARAARINAYAESTEPFVAHKPFKIGVDYERKQDEHDAAQLKLKHEREELRVIKQHGRRLAEEYHRHAKTDQKMTHEAAVVAEELYAHEMARLSAVALKNGTPVPNKDKNQLKNAYTAAMKMVDKARHERQTLFAQEEQLHADVFLENTIATHKLHENEENCLAIFTKNKTETFQKLFDAHSDLVQSVDPAPKAPKAAKKAKAPKTPKTTPATPASTGAKSRGTQQHSKDFLAGVAAGVAAGVKL